MDSVKSDGSLSELEKESFRKGNFSRIKVFYKGASNNQQLNIFGATNVHNTVEYLWYYFEVKCVCMVVSFNHKQITAETNLYAKQLNMVYIFKLQRKVNVI